MGSTGAMQVSASSGMGVAVAARPSTEEEECKPASMTDNQGDGKDESPRRRCQAAELRITGCARKHLAGTTCRDAVADKYFLLGDDGLSNREDVRSAFFCARHGEEYIMAIQNTRCSHAGCWRLMGARWKLDPGVPAAHENASKM